MNRRIAFLLLLLSPFQLSAVELFGVDLNNTNRDELRAAVQESGATLISEGNDEQWFDAYDSSSILPGSHRLYLGFVRSSGAFSFAEYEFPGVTTARLLSRLEARYGTADQTEKGQFISDQRHIWNRDGLTIEIFSDWRNYRVLLSYRNETNLRQLQIERQQVFNSTEGVFFY